MVGARRIFTPGIRGAEAVERPFPACVPLTSEEFRQESQKDAQRGDTVARWPHSELLVSEKPKVESGPGAMRKFFRVAKPKLGRKFAWKQTLQ